MNDPNSIIEVKDLTIGYGERVVMRNLPPHQGPSPLMKRQREEGGTGGLSGSW